MSIDGLTQYIFDTIAATTEMTTAASNACVALRSTGKQLHLITSDEMYRTYNWHVDAQVEARQRAAYYPDFSLGDKKAAVNHIGNNPLTTGLIGAALVFGDYYVEAELSGTGMSRGHYSAYWYSLVESYDQWLLATFFLPHAMDVGAFKATIPNIQKVRAYRKKVGTSAVPPPAVWS